jgi:replication-associated recombination protein RarA
MQIVGQRNLLNLIDKQIETDNFPRFSILCGYEGYGKETLSTYIAKKLNCDVVYFENKIDDIRQCIEMAYSYTQPVLYIIKDAQDMSLAAKNSLLKVAEEPPENVRIILLCTSKEYLLSTVLSRGVLYQLEDYTQNELRQFISTNYPKYTQEEMNNILSICSCPGEIISCTNINTKDLVEDCDNIVNNLHKATLANILKITSTIKTSDKDKEDNYPLTIFCNCLQNRLRLKLLDKNVNTIARQKYVKFIDIIADSRRLAFSKNTNKSMLVDAILIEAYKLWN